MNHFKLNNPTIKLRFRISAQPTTKTTAQQQVKPSRWRCESYLNDYLLVWI